MFARDKNVKCFGNSALKWNLRRYSNPRPLVNKEIVSTTNTSVSYIGQANTVNSTAIATSSSQIVDINDDVSDLQDQVLIHTNNISSIVSDVSLNKINFAQNSNNISTLTSEFTNLSSGINADAINLNSIENLYLKLI